MTYTKRSRWRKRKPSRQPITEDITDNAVSSPSSLSSPLPPRIITDEELLEDGEVILELIIPGRAATKKNHQDIAWTAEHKPILLPSPQFQRFEKANRELCVNTWYGAGRVPIDYGVAIYCRIFLNSWAGVGDHVGYLQSIGDILEKHKILANDKWIHWNTGMNEHWFGGVDKLNPRTELIIRRFRHPLEFYRQSKIDETLDKVKNKLIREELTKQRQEERLRKAEESAKRKLIREELTKQRQEERLRKAEESAKRKNI